MTEENETKNEVTHIDFKDITRLQGHVNPHARMTTKATAPWGCRFCCHSDDICVILC